MAKIEAVNNNNQKYQNQSNTLYNWTDETDSELMGGQVVRVYDPVIKSYIYEVRK